MKVPLFCSMFMKLVLSWLTHISYSCSLIGKNAFNQLTLLSTVHIYIQGVMSIVVNAINTRIRVQIFPLPFFLFHLVMFCAQNPSCYMYQGAHNMPSNLCQGSCNMLHTPNTHNMPKSCMIWTLNMAKNAKVKKMRQRVLCRRKNCNITLVN